MLIILIYPESYKETKKKVIPLVFLWPSWYEGDIPLLIFLLSFQFYYIFKIEKHTIWKKRRHSIIQSLCMISQKVVIWKISTEMWLDRVIFPVFYETHCLLYRLFMTKLLQEGIETHQEHLYKSILNIFSQM